MSLAHKLKQKKQSSIRSKAYPGKLHEGILMPEKLKLASNLLKKVKHIQAFMKAEIKQTISICSFG